MKPLKNLEPIANWGVRISAAALIICLFGKELTTWNFGSYQYIVHMLYLLAAVMLLVAGLQKKPTTTVICGLIICGLSIFMIYPLLSEGKILFQLPFFYTYLLLAFTGLWFAARG